MIYVWKTKTCCTSCVPCYGEWDHVYLTEAWDLAQAAETLNPNQSDADVELWVTGWTSYVECRQSASVVMGGGAAKADGVARVPGSGGGGALLVPAACPWGR
jgi:hypothetical protein